VNTARPLAVIFGPSFLTFLRIAAVQPSDRRSPDS